MQNTESNRLKVAHTLNHLDFRKLPFNKLIEVVRVIKYGNEKERKE